MASETHTDGGGSRRGRAMTRQQIADRLAVAADVTPVQAARMLDALAALAYEQVRDGPTGTFTVPGIARVSLIRYPPRTGRNPATGEEISIPTRPDLKVSLTPEIKDAVLGP